MNSSWSGARDQATMLTCAAVPALIIRDEPPVPPHATDRYQAPLQGPVQVAAPRRMGCSALIEHASRTETTMEPLAQFDPRLVKMAPSGEPPEA
jgi:hypothetical protein